MLNSSPNLSFFLDDEKVKYFEEETLTNMGFRVFYSYPAIVDHNSNTIYIPDLDIKVDSKNCPDPKREAKILARDALIKFIKKGKSLPNTSYFSQAELEHFDHINFEPVMFYIPVFFSYRTKNADGKSSTKEGIANE